MNITLDWELFILFLQSGVWLDYAQTYLDPEKTDNVNVSALVAKLAAASRRGNARNQPGLNTRSLTRSEQGMVPALGCAVLFK